LSKNLKIFRDIDLMLLQHSQSIPVNNFKYKQMDELNQVCGLEWKKFDWSLMPKDVHQLNVYAWKIYIIAVLIKLKY